MESSLTFGRLVRNLILLALLGFLVVLFAKPLFTAAALILAFALIGFLLWLPLHTLVLGRRAPLRSSLDQGRSATLQVLAGLSAGWRQLRETVWELATVVGPMLLEVGSGAVLGGLLVWAHEGPHQDSRALPLGILAGMVAGVLVACSQRRPVAEDTAP